VADGPLKLRLPTAIILAVSIAWIVYCLRAHRDDVRTVRWHDLQQQGSTHELQQKQYDEHHGAPAPSAPALTPAEHAELNDLDKWAESRGERAAP
jgi:hypothetical protein